jgi:hypothetical protein
VKRLTLSAVVLALLAGCGGSDTPEDVTRDFLQAMADGDGERACDLLTGDARREMLVAGAFFDAGDGGCPGAIEGITETLDEGELAKLRDAEVEEVEVNGDQATVKVKDGDPAHLRKIEGEWRIDLEDLPE